MNEHAQSATAAPTTLDELKSLPIWVGWQNVTRKGKTTKLPYDPKNGKMAASDNPQTWTTHCKAEEWARDHNVGYGVVFTTVAGTLHLGGIDLDSCRDPQTGSMEPWALDVIKRLGSYTEVSPSGTGVKVFFLYSLSDKAELDTLFGGENRHGRMFKRGGGEHPPAIEVHRSHRYFTVTWHTFENYDALRVISMEDWRWLINEAGPAFGGKPKKDAPKDGSRSAKAFREGARLKAAGKTYEEMREALRNSSDPAIVAWVNEKGLADDERELHRIFEHATAQRVDDDGRPRILAPQAEGPRAEIMRLLDRILLTDEPEPPMRDLLGHVVGVQLKEPAGIHLLTAETVNANGDRGDEEVSRLPAPPHLSFYRHDKYSLELLIEKHACFYKLVKNKETGEYDEIEVCLPEPFINAYLGYKASKLPRVNSIATMPLVLPNGEILAKNGLDRKRKILFRIEPEMIEVLPRGAISEAEIVEAMQFLIEDWLVDVQTDYEGKCVLIAQALAVLQHALFAERPAFFVVAAKAGGGKTTVEHMISVATTGKRAPAAAWSPVEEERRKAIFAAFRQGLQFLIFDNMKRGTSVSCPHVEKAITAETIEDRVLCTSDREEAPSTCVLSFTGNNVQPKGDLASRSLIARIVVDRPDPANRQFKHPDPIQWTLDHRGQILTALYTILLGNKRLRQKPKEREPAKTRFKAWWASIGAPIEHAADLHCQHDPLVGRPVDFAKLVAMAEEEDEEATSLAEALEIMAKMSGSGDSFRSAQVVTWLALDGDDAATLRAFFFVKENVTIATRTVSNKLKAHLDTPVIVGGEIWTLKLEWDAKTNTARYRIHKKKIEVAGSA